MKKEKEKIKVSQIPKKKKLNEKQIKIEFLKMDLEHKKEVYESHLKGLIEYGMPSLLYGNVMYKELYHNILHKKLKECSKDSKSFMKLMFGERTSTEIERLELDIKWYDKIIKLAEHEAEKLPQKVKMKIAKDCFKYKQSWLGLPE